MEHDSNGIPFEKEFFLLIHLVISNKLINSMKRFLFPHHPFNQDDTLFFIFLLFVDFLLFLLHER